MRIIVMGGSFNPPTIAHLKMMQSALDQLETQRISTLAQLQAAQIQYFGLKDSVEQGIAALDAMKKQYTNIDYYRHNSISYFTQINTII